MSLKLHVLTGQKRKWCLVLEYRTQSSPLTNVVISSHLHSFMCTEAKLSIFGWCSTSVYVWCDLLDDDKNLGYILISEISFLSRFTIRRATDDTLPHGKIYKNQTPTLFSNFKKVNCRWRVNKGSTQSSLSNYAIHILGSPLNHPNEGCLREIDIWAVAEVDWHTLRVEIDWMPSTILKPD